MRDPLLCLVDRLPGLLLGGMFALYHLPLLVVARDAESFTGGSGHLIALFVTLLDLAVVVGVIRIYRSLGMPFRRRDALQVAGLLPLSLALFLLPSGAVRWGLSAYTLYAGGLGRLDRLSPLLGMVALITLAFVMVLQNLNAPLSRLLQDLGWLFAWVGLGEILGCGKERAPE